MEFSEKGNENVHPKKEEKYDVNFKTPFDKLKSRLELHGE